MTADDEATFEEATAELRELAEEIRDRHDLMLKLDLNPEDASEELIWVNAAFRA